ncbi:MAG: hypothetical protein IH991_05345 [Planctomycetes bacterium]|nr:hypothetical protein [Planctomycetota bacterium]
MGWNRLIEELSNPTENGNLDERLNEAVQARREQQGNNLLDSFPEGFAATDSEGCITYVNRAFSALLANDAENHQLVGSAMLDFLGIDSAAESGEDSQQSSLVDPASLGRTTISELPRSFGNGQRVLRVARHPISNAGQASRAKHIWSVRDVTQQKLAEKMRDDFLDSATHELRTPLANIKAYSEALTLSEAMDFEQQKDFCNTINSEVTRLARLIDDLLSISSLEVGSLTVAKQRIELDRLLVEIVGKVAPLMKEKDLDFQTTLPDKVPQLKLDKDKFSVALVNLLGNAAKYTPQGGRVALDVQVKDDRLVVSVEDSGIGISSDEQPRLFEKFFRSADQHVQSESGTGLGLSLANEIIQLHGGAITVESELGKGSTFTITVPLT